MVDIVKGEIWNRNDFGTLCEWRTLYRCVEVGVDRGDFAEVFLRRNYNCQLYMVIDPYLPYHGMPYDREGDYMTMLEKLRRHSNAKIIRSTSAEAIASLKTADAIFWRPPYSFVYLDADHREEAVYEQCCAWWDLIVDGGVLAGHDWACTSGDHQGVREAVIRFATERNLTIRHTYHDDPQSWYINKGAPELERHPGGL